MRYFYFLYLLIFVVIIPYSGAMTRLIDNMKSPGPAELGIKEKSQAEGAESGEPVPQRAEEGSADKAG